MTIRARTRRVARPLAMAAGALALAGSALAGPVLAANATAHAATVSAAARSGWPTPRPVDVYLYSFGHSRAMIVLRPVAYGTVSPYERVASGDYTVARRPPAPRRLPSPSFPPLLPAAASSTRPPAPA